MIMIFGGCKAFVDVEMFVGSSFYHLVVTALSGWKPTGLKMVAHGSILMLSLSVLLYNLAKMPNLIFEIFIPIFG